MKKTFNKTFLLPLAFFLFAFSILLFAPSINYDFLYWDDDQQITENPYIKTINKENVLHNVYQERFTAFTLFTYMLDYKFYNLNPTYYRLVNIILHGINVLLVFWLVWLIFGKIEIAFLTALLFACHPLRVESVVWISERKDLLFTFWGLLAFLSYRKFIISKNVFFLALVLAFSLISSYSKIQGLLIPFSLFLIDYWYERRISINMIFEKIFIFIFVIFFYNKWLFIFALIYFLWLVYKDKFNLKLNLPVFKIKFATRLVIVSASLFLVLFISFIASTNFFELWNPDTLSKSKDFSIVDRFFLGTYALSHYLHKFLVPINLSAIYAYPVKINGMLPIIYYVSSLIIIPFLLLFYYIFVKKNIKKLVVFGIFFFLINISFVLHIFPIEGRLVAGDRYTYLAYFGLFIIISYFVFSLKKTIISWLISALIIGGLTVLTYNRIPVWQNSETLFTDVLKKDSTVAFAWSNLGAFKMHNREFNLALEYLNNSIYADSSDPSAYYNRGLVHYNLKNYNKSLSDFDFVIRNARGPLDSAVAYNDMGQCYLALGLIEKSLTYYRKSISNSAKNASAYNNLGWYYYITGRLDSSEYYLRKAVETNPDFSDALNNLGSVLLQFGKTDSALYLFDLSIKKRPSYTLAYNNKGYALLQNNDLSGALVAFNQAIKTDSLFLQAYMNRAWVYFNRKEYEKAIFDYSNVIRLDSLNITALINRGYTWFLLNKNDLSIKDFSKAINIDPQNSDLYFNRANAYLSNNSFEKAISDFNKAISINSRNFVFYNYRGIAYYKMKNYYNAINDFNHSVMQNAEQIEPYYYLAKIYDDKNNKERVCFYINEAIKRGYSINNDDFSTKCN